MSNTIKNQNAFPSDHTNPEYLGLTKREYFASLAMQGIISSNVVQRASFEFNGTENRIAKISVLLADALINELNKEK